MKTYYLYWLDGKKETIQGDTIDDAYRKSGLSVGALQALDAWSNKDEFIWNAEKKHWENK